MKHAVIRLLQIAGAAALTGILVLPGCAVQAGGDEGETQSASDAATGIPLVRDETSVKKGITDQPANFVTWVEIGTGSWGTWSTVKTYCEPNSYAYTAWIRAESAQGSNDDTAMNEFWMECFDKNTGAYTGPLLSNSGPHGNQYPTATTDPFTTTNPFVGGRMKIEASQGSGDDTAANQVALVAMNGHETQPQAATGWGTWNTSISSPFKCPANTAVCGLQTRVEPNGGGGFDDTALNGIRLGCCTF